MSKNRAIGVNNRLPWNLPADMARFTHVTTGHPVIMGSKTYESIPEKFRPLPGRTSIVLSRDKNKQYKGATVVHSLSEALQAASKAPGSEEVMVIGGGKVFEEALPLAGRVYLTVVDADIPDADTFFPEVDLVRWSVRKEGSFQKDSKNEYGGDFFTYERSGKHPVVEPQNGRTPEYRDRLQKVAESNICPFCPDGITQKEEETIFSNEGWFVKHNSYPLSNTLYHFLLTPHRHILSMDDLTRDEWDQFKDARAWLKDNFTMLGDATYVRSGEPLVTGATVAHLHAHIIVPAGQVNVSFGKWKERAALASTGI